MARFLSASCALESIQSWECCLFAATHRLVDAPVSVILPNDDAIADVRVALRSRNLLPAVQQGYADADEAAALSLMLESPEGLCPARKALRVAAFDCIKYRVKAAGRGPTLTILARDAQDLEGSSNASSQLQEGQMSGVVNEKVFISYAWDVSSGK